LVKGASIDYEEEKGGFSLDLSISTPTLRHRCAIVPITGRTQLMMFLKPAVKRIGKIAPENFVTSLWRKGKIIRSDDPRSETQNYLHRIETIWGEMILLFCLNTNSKRIEDGRRKNA
jgi:hypothetical protein